MDLFIKLLVLICLTATVCHSKLCHSFRTREGREQLIKSRFRAKRQSGGYSDEPNEAPSQEFFSNPFSSPEIGSQDTYSSSSIGGGSFGSSSYSEPISGNDYSQASIGSFPDKIPYAQLADPSVTKKTITDTSYLSSLTSSSDSGSPSHTSYNTGTSQSSQYNPSGTSTLYSGYDNSQQSLYPQSGSPYQSNSRTGKYSQSSGYNPNSYANRYQPSSSIQSSRFSNPRSMYSHSISNYGLQGGGYSAGYTQNDYDETAGTSYDPYQSSSAQSSGQGTGGGGSSHIRIGSSSTQYFGSDDSSSDSSSHYPLSSSDSSSGSQYNPASSSSSSNQYQQGSSYDPSDSNPYNPYATSNQYSSSNPYQSIGGMQYAPNPHYVKSRGSSSNSYGQYGSINQYPYNPNQYGSTQSQGHSASSPYGQYNQYGVGSSPYGNPNANQYKPYGSQYNRGGSSQFSSSGGNGYTPYSANQYNPSGSYPYNQYSSSQYNYPNTPSYNPAAGSNFGSNQYAGGHNTGTSSGYPYSQTQSGYPYNQNSRSSSYNQNTPSQSYSRQGGSYPYSQSYQDTYKYQAGQKVYGSATGTSGSPTAYKEDDYVPAGAGSRLTSQDPTASKTYSSSSSSQYTPNTQNSRYLPSSSHNSYPNTPRRQGTISSADTGSYLSNAGYSGYQTGNSYIPQEKASTSTIHNSGRYVPGSSGERSYSSSGSSGTTNSRSELYPFSSYNTGQNPSLSNSGSPMHGTNTHDSNIPVQTSSTSGSQQSQYNYLGGSLLPADVSSQDPVSTNRQTNQFYSPGNTGDTQTANGAYNPSYYPQSASSGSQDSSSDSSSQTNQFYNPANTGDTQTANGGQQNAYHPSYYPQSASSGSQDSSSDSSSQTNQFYSAPNTGGTQTANGGQQNTYNPSFYPQSASSGSQDSSSGSSSQTNQFYNPANTGDTQTANGGQQNAYHPSYYPQSASSGSQDSSSGSSSQTNQFYNPSNVGDTPNDGQQSSYNSNFYQQSSSGLPQGSISQTSSETNEYYSSNVQTNTDEQNQLYSSNYGKDTSRTSSQSSSVTSDQTNRYNPSEGDTSNLPNQYDYYDQGTTGNSQSLPHTFSDTNPNLVSQNVGDGKTATSVNQQNQFSQTYYNENSFPTGGSDSSSSNSDQTNQFYNPENTEGTQTANGGQQNAYDPSYYPQSSSSSSQDSSSDSSSQTNQFYSAENTGDSQTSNDGQQSSYYSNYYQPSSSDDSQDSSSSTSNTGGTEPPYQWSDTGSESDPQVVYQPDNSFPYNANNDETNQPESSSEENAGQFVFTGNMGGLSNRGVPYNSMAGYQNQGNTQDGAQEPQRYSYEDGATIVSRGQIRDGTSGSSSQSGNPAEDSVSTPTLSRGRNRGRLGDPVVIHSDGANTIGYRPIGGRESYTSDSDDTSTENIYASSNRNSANRNSQAGPETVYRPALVSTNDGQDDSSPLSILPSETTRYPDLKLDRRKLMTSFFVDYQEMGSLLCAKSANCLSSSANPDNLKELRKLLKFETTVKNIGNGDFLPLKSKKDWLWHNCHNHSHSMEVFSQYDLIDKKTNVKVAEGLKASFCLEDSECENGVVPKYDCEKGTQGISPRCTDTYKASIDCQWIDVTDVRRGQYKFQVLINPGRQVKESDYTNNGIECGVTLEKRYADIWGCKHITV